MLKKTITYPNLDGEMLTEDFYFHLSKSELARMELSTEGGFVEALNKVIKSENGKQIIDTFERIILDAYGERSEDNKRFIKSKELSEAFSQTGAYDVLFLQLVTDANAGAEFIRGIVPADLEENARQLPFADQNPPADNTQDVVKAIRDMSPEDLQKIIAAGQERGPIRRAIEDVPVSPFSD